MAELTTLARPYATAVFNVAKSAGKLALWDEYLQSMAGIAVQEKVQHFLASPSLTAEQKSEAFAKLLGEDVDQEVKNFVSVLAENKRLELLPEISVLFAALKAAQEQSIAVSISAAFDVSEAQVATLTQALKKKLDRDVTLTTEVDKSLIGGAILRAGDTVIDGSVKGRLIKLAESLNA